MKILILSHVDTSIKFFFAQHFSKFLISKKHQVSFDLDENSYDICLFSESYDSLKNLKKLDIAKKYVVLDPKMNSRIQILNLKDSDGAIVSSLEQAERVYKYQKNILIQPWFRFAEASDFSMLKNDSNALPNIVYHGNKVHLEASSETLGRALQRLSKERQFIFTAIYNIKKLGIWKKFLPRGVNIRHIQWEPETYLSHIAQSDIGVIPNFLPTGPKLLNYLGHKIVEKSKIGVRTNINKKDYLNRYKFTSNSGRLYEFAIFSKPVVAEPTLSISQDIVHSVNGFLVLTDEGWYRSLISLLDDPKLRSNIGVSFKNDFLSRHCKDYYFLNMQKYLESIVEQ